MIITLLLLVPALAVQTQYSVTGTIPLSEEIISANTTVTFNASNANLTSDKIEIMSAWNVSGTPYPYMRRISVHEPAGVSRTNEKLVDVIIPSNKMRAGCADLRLTTKNGDLINYYRKSCGTNAVIDTVINSIPSGGDTELFAYYGTPEEVSDGSTTITGSFTQTHTNQLIGSCSSGGDHCYLAHIGGSSCGISSTYSPGYKVYVTGQHCSTFHSCGSGCYGGCSIKDWVGDLGSTLGGSGGGWTSCNTAITGGYTHYFTLDWSQLLTSSVSAEESPDTVHVSVLEDESLVSSQNLTGAVNITLNRTSPAEHNITINAGNGTFMLKSYIEFNNTGVIDFSRELNGSDVKYYGELSTLVSGDLIFRTPPDVTQRSSNKPFTFSGGEWRFTNVTGVVQANFTTQAHTINITSLTTPKITIKHSGVSDSNVARACYNNKCYLEYNSSIQYNASGVPLVSDSLLNIGVHVDEPSDCSVGEVRNHTSSNQCILEFPLTQPNTTISTENSSTWRVGRKEVSFNLTEPLFSLSVKCPSSPGRIEYSVTTQLPNVTLLLVKSGKTIDYKDYYNATPRASFSVSSEGEYSVIALGINTTEWASAIKSCTIRVYHPAPSSGGSGGGGATVMGLSISGEERAEHKILLKLPTNKLHKESAIPDYSSLLHNELIKDNEKLLLEGYAQKLSEGVISGDEFISFLNELNTTLRQRYTQATPQPLKLEARNLTISFSYPQRREPPNLLLVAPVIPAILIISSAYQHIRRWA